MSSLARVALLSLLLLGFVRVTAAESDEITSLRIKAEHGNALAQYNLGLAYAQGRQVTADPAEAFAWLSLASESGATGKALDSLLGNITDAQLADGRHRFAIYRAAVIAQSVETKARSAPKLAPRGFTLESRSPVVSESKAATPVTKAPEAVAPPISTSPAEGAGAAELAQARKDLEKAQVDLVSANNELAALRADQARLEAAASEAKAREAKLSAELQAAQRELSALRPVPSPAPAPKP
jgi:hypothetical protein